MLRIADIPRRKRFRLRWRAIAIFAVVFAGFFASIYVQENQYSMALLAASVVLLGSLIEFVFADIVTDQLYPARTQGLLDRLEHDLRAYHDRIRETIGDVIKELRGCDQSRVSGTFHLVVEQFLVSDDGVEEALVQVTDYSGQLGGKRWRFTPATKGLIGRCLRSGRSEWVNFRNEEEYAARMVEEFGFTRAEIAKHTRQARSYWAEPVYARRKMIGVIFIFSTEAQVFPHAVVSPSLQCRAREMSAFLQGAGIV